MTYGVCAVCGRQGEVLLTIYGESGRHVLRCLEHLNQLEDYRPIIRSVLE
jgi:hypothetical protein